MFKNRRPLTRAYLLKIDAKAIRPRLTICLHGKFRGRGMRERQARKVPITSRCKLLDNSRDGLGEIAWTIETAFLSPKRD
jgi:hypothetical protein